MASKPSPQELLRIKKKIRSGRASKADTRRLDQKVVAKVDADLQRIRKKLRKGKLSAADVEALDAIVLSVEDSVSALRAAVVE